MRFAPIVIAAAILPAVLATGCGEGTEPRSIEQTRIVDSPWRGGLRRLSPAHRFGLAAEEDPRPKIGPPEFRYKLPAGWTAETPTMMRAINLRAAGDPKAECYVTILPGLGGGIPDNVNRWRGQMQQPDISAAEVAKLPRRKLPGLANAEAVMLDLEGAYQGMGMKAALPGYRFLGAIFIHRGYGIFIRLSGPADVVAKERASFEAFLDSLEDKVRAPQPGPSAGGLTWEVPPGWKVGPKRSMRIVTLVPAGEASVECYVSMAGGSLKDNADRWRRQMGKGPLTEAEVAKLEKTTVAGREGRILEVSGDYAGMGGKSIKDAMMLGVIVPAGETSLFVKMIGPATEVAARRAEFVAFIRSLKAAR